jgi:hypothetical protein
MPMPEQNRRSFMNFDDWEILNQDNGRTRPFLGPFDAVYGDRSARTPERNILIQTADGNPPIQTPERSVLIQTQEVNILIQTPDGNIPIQTPERNFTIRTPNRNISRTPIYTPLPTPIQCLFQALEENITNQALEEYIPNQALEENLLNQALEQNFPNEAQPENNLEESIPNEFLELAKTLHHLGPDAIKDMVCTPTPHTAMYSKIHWRTYSIH